MSTVYYLARLMPSLESTPEMRSLVCLDCSDSIVTAAGLTNEDARELTARHYRRRDVTHGVGPELRLDDVVFAPRDPALEHIFPDSLLLVLRGAA